MKVALIVLDGWGIGPDDDPTRRNAIASAETPTVDRYWETAAAGKLDVTGRSVGLPEGQMGNSEVGHINIGAGRIVYQDYTRINAAIDRSNGASDAPEAADLDDPPFDQNPAITDALEHVETTGGTFHLLGLVSDGGVHSDIAHFSALIELTAGWDINAVTHAIMDGRDTAPKAGIDHLETLRSTIEEHDTGHIGTIVGRYYAMDRDNNWDRTLRAYRALVDREAPHHENDPIEALKQSYADGITDEFVEPICLSASESISDGDAAFFVNFRSDRSRQLTRLLASIRPEEWEEVGISIDPPSIHLTTMTEYDRTFSLPVAFEPVRPETPLGEVLSTHDCTQLRMAESEKYPHVTYFFNGGREITFPGEHRHIEPSPDVPTYDEAPAMNAPALTDRAIELLESIAPTVLILNYANPDMVGHTGDFDATVTAIETVDTELDRLVAACHAAGADVLITADHGNAENMGTTDDPHTAHTTNPVPVFSLPPTECPNRSIRSGGILADIAPTVLDLLNIEPPDAMTGSTLLTRDGNP